MQEPGGPKDVAKIQKNAHIDADLCRLIDAYQDRTGATFSRIVTAAVLRFLFTEPYDSWNPLWMSSAVRSEKGKVGIGQVPVEVFERIARTECRNRTAAEKCGDEDATTIALREEQRAVTALNHWLSITKNQDDPIAAIIEHQESPFEPLGTEPTKDAPTE